MNLLIVLSYKQIFCCPKGSIIFIDLIYETLKGFQSILCYQHQHFELQEYKLCNTCHCLTSTHVLLQLLLTSIFLTLGCKCQCHGYLYSMHVIFLGNNERKKQNLGHNWQLNLRIYELANRICHILFLHIDFRLSKRLHNFE